MHRVQGCMFSGMARHAERACIVPTFAYHARHATDFGRPISPNRFKILQAKAASISCAWTCRARSLPPRTCSCLKKAFLTMTCRFVLESYEGYEVVSPRRTRALAKSAQLVTRHLVLYFHDFMPQAVTTGKPHPKKARCRHHREG